MKIDVVIPTRRPRAVLWALESLAAQSRRPDFVTLVTNEIAEPPSVGGLRIRVLHFRSDFYPIGDRDVALRRNVGIFFSHATHVITFDDDQVAPPNMVEDSARLLAGAEYFWGHHRYIPFAGKSVAELQSLPAYAGRPREHPPNAWHLYLSCYGGLFGADLDMLRDAGGYDMIFCERQAGEDQSLGRRLARMQGSEKVYIHEPPFAWHPDELLPWAEVRYSNLCAGPHDAAVNVAAGIRIERCKLCPHLRALDDDLARDEVVLRFDPGRVKVDVVGR